MKTVSFLSCLLLVLQITSSVASAHVIRHANCRIAIQQSDIDSGMDKALQNKGFIPFVVERVLTYSNPAAGELALRYSAVPHPETLIRISTTDNWTFFYLGLNSLKESRAEAFQKRGPKCRVVSKNFSVPGL